VAANFLGTTGAAMLLIRPWINLNRGRVAAHHIVFFIFIVANAGGCLTPVGDPPLFLGYLQGVPFWWITEQAWPVWALGVGLLLAAFYALDTADFIRRRPAAPQRDHPNGKWEGLSNKADGRDAGPTIRERWKFDGLANLFFLAIILGAVFVERPIFLREGVMLAAALGSYFTTPKAIHAANHFDFHPLREVVILFAGIFATMMPALDWLGANAREIFGANPPPGICFWSAGGLSAILDNAPTYLVFLNALLGATGAPGISSLLNQHAGALLAVSVGSVFFGAATYIGNGPNFMIKTVAEQEKICAPRFLEFVWKFALPFLLPALAALWLIFFRG